MRFQYGDCTSCRSGFSPTPAYAGRWRRAKARPTSPTSRGFTLLELLLALGLVGLLMAIVLPNFGPAIARAQLTSATRDVASALRHVRGQALMRGKDAEFELDIERHRYKVTGRNKSYSLPGGIGLSLYTAESETVDEGAGRIRFFPDGSATGGRVTLAGGGRKNAVDVNWLTGEVKIREDEDDAD